MKHTTVISVLAVLICAAGAGAYGEDRAFTEKYGILLDHSIFSRTRGRPSVRPPTTYEAPRPAQQRVLTGIARQGESAEFVAFIEDTTTGATTRARQGESVAQGKLTQIGFDFVEFTLGGRALRVELGRNLEGGEPVRSSYSRYSTTPSAPGPATRPSGGSAEDIVEQMRQRAARERGGQ